MSEMFFMDNCKVACFKAPTGDYRQIVKQSMLDQSNITWTPRETFKIEWKNKERFKINLTYEKGVVYHGICYTENQGSLDEFEQFVEDGVFDFNSNYYEECIGNHCSASMNKAFQLLIDLPFDGLLKPSSVRGTKITFAGNLKKPTAFGDQYDSFDVFDLNPKREIMEAYALVDTGDIVHYTNKKKSGHTRMVSKKSDVVRFDNGEIDPDNSHVYCIEQTNAWDKTECANGKNTTWWIDHKYSFAKLYETHFMPTTLTIYTSGEVSKDAYVIYSGNNSSSTVSEGLNGNITSNFPLTYVNATVRNTDNKIVRRSHVYKLGSRYSVDLEELNEKLMFDSLEKGCYTITIRAGIARGGVDFEKFDFEIK